MSVLAQASSTKENPPNLSGASTEKAENMLEYTLETVENLKEKN